MKGTEPKEAEGYANGDGAEPPPTGTVAYWWPVEETSTCEECVLEGRGNGTGMPVPIAENELVTGDETCDQCGERLVALAEPPRSFEEMWTERQARSKKRAREEREHRVDGDDTDEQTEA